MMLDNTASIFVKNTDNASITHVRSCALYLAWKSDGTHRTSMTAKSPFSF